MLPGFLWSLVLPMAADLEELVVEVAVAPVDPRASREQVHEFLVGADLAGSRARVDHVGTGIEPGLRCYRSGTYASAATGRHDGLLTVAVRRQRPGEDPVDLVATCRVAPEALGCVSVLMEPLLWGAALLQHLRDSDAPSTEVSAQTTT